MRLLARASPLAALFALFALANGPAMAQHLGQAVDDPAPWWRIAAVLALGLILAAGAAVALHARTGGVSAVGKTRASIWSMTAKLPIFKGAGSALRLTETVRLSHQADLCLVEWRDREMLIAATAQGVVVLGERAGPALPSTPV